MSTIRGQVKMVGFVLIATLAIGGIFFHLYNHAYASAMLQSLMILPAIINRKQLLDKWRGLKHV